MRTHFSISAVIVLCNLIMIYHIHFTNGWITQRPSTAKLDIVNVTPSNGTIDEPDWLELAKQKKRRSLQRITQRLIELKLKD